MSSGISFLYRFDVGNRDIYNPGSKIVSISPTADGDFDKANLTTDSVRHVWRSASILTWQDIVIEADRESEIDTFGILGHNLSQDAVVLLQANYGNNFSAPPVSIALPWSRQNIVCTTSLGDVYKYYRVRILDPGNPCGYIEVGRLVGGQAIIMENCEDIVDDFEIGYEDMAKQMKTEGFFRTSNENVKVRTISAKFQKLKTQAGQNANFLALREMFQYVGTTRPLLAMVNRDDPSFCSLWGQMKDIPAESYTINQYVSMSFKCEEVF